MGCFGLNLVKLRLQQSRKRMQKCGLEQKQIQLQNNTITLDCWLPSNREINRPNLLLIHGIVFEALLEWEDQIEPFTKEFNLYVVNLLFFGKSNTQHKQRSEMYQAECMKELLDELNISETHILGTSYGGMVAFWMAHFYPQKVHKLVICSSGVAMDSNYLPTFVKRFGGVSVSQSMLPDTNEDARKLIHFAVYKKPFLPGCLLEDIVEEVFGRNREHRKELLDELIAGSPNAPPLPSIKTKDVLIILGEHDLIFLPELAYSLKSHLNEHAKLVMIPESGHTPQAENPKVFNATVLEFLNSKN